MDKNELISKYLPLLKKHWLPMSLGALGMTFFAYGLIGLFVSSKSASDNIVFEANSAVKTATEIKTIAADIEGAVVRPGLYKLPQDSRFQDALVAAGGMSASANRDYVAKNLNLATKLTDGAKIYIPFVGEAFGNSLVPTGGLMNINSASEPQLEGLPGIGPASASKIIEGRPYNSVEDLLNKKIVGSKVFSQIKDKITVY